METARGAARRFSDGKGRILSDEERAAENFYIQKMERERMEKLKKAEQEKAAKEKEAAEKNLKEHRAAEKANLHQQMKARIFVLATGNKFPPYDFVQKNYQQRGSRRVFKPLGSYPYV